MEIGIILKYNLKLTAHLIYYIHMYEDLVNLIFLLRNPGKTA